MLNTGHKISWITGVNRLKNRDGYFKKIGINEDATLKEWLLWATTLNNIEKIDIIVNFSEDNQDKAAFIAQKLNINYHSIDTVEKVNNKLKMRKALEDLKINSIPFKEIESGKDIIESFKKIKKPIIVKPVNGRGSNMIFYIHNHQEASNKAALIDKLLNKNNIELIAEEFIEGDEFSVEIFSENGKHKLIAITDKFKLNNFVEIGHCLPAVISENAYDTIQNYMFSVLDALNIKSGVTHSEVIRSNKNDKVFLVETHLRMGGDYIPILIKNVYDIDILKMWTDSLLSHTNVKELNDNNRYSAVYFKPCDKTGAITDITIRKSIDSEVSIVDTLKKVNDFVVPTSKSKDRLAYAIATSENFNLAINKAKKALDNVIINIDSDNNYIRDDSDKL